MNIITLSFLVIGILSAILAGILLVSQGYLLVKKWGRHNGMKPYRLLLFLMTFAIFMDNIIFACSDFLLYFFDIKHGYSFDGLVVARLFARATEIITLTYFYRLIYLLKNGNEITDHDNQNIERIKKDVKKNSAGIKDNQSMNRRILANQKQVKKELDKGVKKN